MANVNIAYDHKLYPTQSTMYSQNDRYKQHDRHYIGIGQPIPNPHVLVVDSRSRHHGTDTIPSEEPNDYKYVFPYAYKDITSIELVNAEIPNSGYTIENTHNALRFIISGTTYDITVPVGNYDIASLCTALQSAMNADSSGFIVTASTINNLITISNSSSFQLIFIDGTEAHGNDTTPIYNDRTGSTMTFNNNGQNKYRANTIAPVLGFERLDRSGAFTYTGKYSYNLRINKYLILSIENMDRLDSYNKTVNGSFCIIPLEDSTSNFNLHPNYGEIDNDAYVKYFQQPLRSLDQMHIRFYDLDGNLYNFHGHDHFLMFKISTMERTGGQ